MSTIQSEVESDMTEVVEQLQADSAIMKHAIDRLIAAITAAELSRDEMRADGQQCWIDQVLD